MSFDGVEEIDVISPRPLLEEEIGQTLASEEYLHWFERVWQLIEENSLNPEDFYFILEDLIKEGEEE